MAGTIKRFATPIRVRPLVFQRFTALAILTFVSCILIYGQSPEGALVGTVVDASGARVAGATVKASAKGLNLVRTIQTGSQGEFRLESLPPGRYEIKVDAPGFAAQTGSVDVAVASTATLKLKLQVAPVKETVNVEGASDSLTAQPIETTSSVIKTTIGVRDLEEIPLAQRSFANIAYLAPMTEPVEPSDPTKARITAVSFGGSSGLNVDLSVDGGDNNDDYIGGFLQNYSPDALQEFTVRTAQFDADTSRTNGGSVIISTRRGTNDWHGDLGLYYRNQNLNARNPLDNPGGTPKQPFSRENGVATLGGPVVKDRLWFFSSLEYVNEDDSIGYSALSLNEFNALSQLAASGQIPGVTSITVPNSAGTPFRNTLFSGRLDFKQSDRSEWFLRGSSDLNRTTNDLVHQGALPSTGFSTTSDNFSVLLSNQFQFNSGWLGNFVFQASNFHHVKVRNSNLGFGLAFPFSSSALTTSGFETFGDNQFVTPITAFPINRDQQKYQFRYDVDHSSGNHAPKFGVNFIHEPVLSGRLADNPETVHILPQDPSFYIANPGAFATDFNDPANQSVSGGNNGRFAQNIQRIGFYAQDAWRIRRNFTVNYGLRYDTTFGLFNSNGGNQSQNPAVLTIAAQSLPLPMGVPHDYRGAVSPRLGIAYSPGTSGNTVIRAGGGLYFNDLAQNGWVDAFRAVDPAAGPLVAGDQGAIIDPHYHSPYSLQATAGIEHAFAGTWKLTINYEHQQGVHQYRRYEYVD